MRIGLIQLNARLSEPEANARALESAYAKAVALGAELVLGPEMALPGYLAEDRLWEVGLRGRIQAASEALAAGIGEVPLVLGTCSPAPSGRLWNELWWCEAGKVRARVHKRILAAYDVFDENRYFEADPEPQPLVAFRGHKVGLTVCEDLWADAELVPGPVRYRVNPVQDLVARGASLLLNASASPAHLGTWLPEGRHASWAIPSKLAQRRRLLEGLSRRHGIPIAYVSRVGAESWLSYDGGSGLAHPDGTWEGAPLFEEAVRVFDTDCPGSPWPQEPGEPEWLRKALVQGLKENLGKQGLEAVVIGLSGGIDSAVVAALAAEALDPQRILGVALPTRFTSRESLDLAELQARELGIHFRTLDAEKPFAGAEAALRNLFPQRGFGLTDENFQSRCRGMLLMGLTSEAEVHRLVDSPRVAVLNTGNKSEAATGYFTLYGDGIGAFGLLGDCLKQRVFALARELGRAVPAGVLNRPPTAELRPDQTDEESLLPYALLDPILAAFVETRRPEACLYDDLADLLEGPQLAQARAAVPRVLKLLRGSEFKRRQLPFALKVSPRAFGQGRRIPLTGL